MSSNLLLSALVPRPAERPSKDYRFCGSIKDYLLQRATCAGIDFSHSRPSAEEKAIAVASGTKNFSKFKRLLEEWHSLNKPIPLTYLTAINAERHIIESLLEYEQENFETAAKAEHRPEGFFIRWMPAIYTPETFPTELQNEEECVAYAQARADMKPQTQAIITCPAKTVWLHAQKKPSVTWHKPVVRWTKNTVTFRSASIVTADLRWTS